MGKFISADDFEWNDNLYLDMDLYCIEVIDKMSNTEPVYDYDEDDDEYYISTRQEDEYHIMKRKFRDIRNCFVWACQETNQMDLIEQTDGWGLRDYISEAEYQASQRIAGKPDGAPEHRAFAMWKRIVNIGTPYLLDEMVCAEEHMSKYDKF